MSRAIAVTGGIASGKSEVTRRFEQLGVPVLDADVIARAVVAPGSAALSRIVQRFGSDILLPDGQLDRRRMRERVFASDAERAALEAIIHPEVRSALRDGVAASAAPYVLLAIPLLVESGDYDWVDRVLVVDVPEAQQIARVMQRDRVTQSQAASTLASQASRSARLARASDVIVNDGPIEALEPIVRRLHAFYDGRLARTTRPD